MEFLKEILGDELYAQVAEKLENAEGITLANIADGSYVSKETYDADIETAKKEAAGSAEPNGDAEKLKGENEKLKEDIAKLKLSSAYELKLVTSGARNSKALRGMIDADKLTLGEDGVLQGYDEQLEGVKNECPWLFETPSAQGMKHGESEPVMDGVEKAFREKNKDLELN